MISGNDQKQAGWLYLFVSFFWSVALLLGGVETSLSGALSLLDLSRHSGCCERFRVIIWLYIEARCRFPYPLTSPED